MSVRISFRPGHVDLLWASFIGIRAKPVVFALGIGFFVILPWAGAIAGLVGRGMGYPVKPIEIAGLFLTPFLAVASFAGLMLMPYRKHPAFQGTHTYEFSSDGIHTRGPGFENRLEWSLMTRCYGSTHGLLFYSGSSPALWVPVRSLLPAERSELLDLLVSKGVERTGPWRFEDSAESPQDLIGDD